MINAHAQPAGYNRDYHPPSTSVTQRTRYKGALPGFGPRHTSMDSTVRPTADELDASHQKSPRHQSKFRQLVTAQWSRSGLGSKSGKNVSNGNTLVKAQPTSKYHSDQEAPVMQPTAPRNGRPISIAEPYYTSGSLVRSDPSLPLQGHREGILKTFTAPPADVQSTRDWAGENLQGGQVRVVPATGLTDITTYEGGLPPSARAPVDSGSGKGHLSGHRGTDPTIMPRSSGPAPLAPRTNGALQTPFGLKQDLPARQAPAALILDASLSSHKALKSFANHEAISKGSLANNVLTVTTVQVTTAGSPDALPFENDPGSYFPEEDRPRMELVTAAVANPMPPFCTRCEASGREWLAQQKDALNAELDEVLAGGIQEEEKRVAAEKKLDAAEKKLDAAEKQLEAQRQLASPESAPPAARVAELEQQVGELVAMLTQRVSPRESAGPGQSLLPDMEVRQQWMTLNWQIRQLVDPNIQLPGRFKDLSQSQLRYLTPAYGDFLRSKDKACLLAEAAIWYVLARYLFATIDKTSWAYWAGKSSAHLRTLGRFKHPPLPLPPGDTQRLTGVPVILSRRVLSENRGHQGVPLMALPHVGLLRLDSREKPRPGPHRRGRGPAREASQARAGQGRAATAAGQDRDAGPGPGRRLVPAKGLVVRLVPGREPGRALQHALRPGVHGGAQAPRARRARRPHDRSGPHQVR